MLLHIHVLLQEQTKTTAHNYYTVPPTTGGGSNVVMAPCHPDTLHPDLDWLANYLADKSNAAATKMVVIINPNNPTGVLVDLPDLERARAMCADAGCWLVMDNTYEHFVYDGRTHHCIGGPNVLNVFSFSKVWVFYWVLPGFTKGIAHTQRASTRLSKRTKTL